MPEGEKGDTILGKPEKSSKDWTGVMDENGGKLAPIIDELFSTVEKASGGEWKNSLLRLQSTTKDFALLFENFSDHTFSGRSTNEEFFPTLLCANDQLRMVILETESDPEGFVKKFDTHRVYVPKKLVRTLLGSAELLSKVLSEHMPQEAADKTYYHTSVDLRNPADIARDNVQTMLDVSSMLARYAENPEALRSLTKYLLQVCPNDEIVIEGHSIGINPRAYTYLELFSLAPFGFWADARTRPPLRCWDQDQEVELPIVRPHDHERPFDPTFIYMITRRKRSEEHTSELQSQR